MSSEWDEYAGDWDSNEDVAQYSDRASQSLNEIQSPDGLIILDFGCGTGRLTEKMAQTAKRVVGLDTSTEMLAVLKAKRLSNVDTIEDELTVELVEEHALLRAKFDLIVASSVCGFLPDYEGALGLLKSLLVPGGIFVQWDWRAEEEGSGSGLTSDAILGALNSVGFESASVASPFSIANSESVMSVLMGVGKNP